MTTLHANRIDSFAGKHVLVIGDIILDVYLKGRSTRLSPEAPVRRRKKVRARRSGKRSL
jgi:D-beta-D-heptose 7-phosphate kinase/D-beta-D-heptose 1-phosphate adenosyltransferase